MNVFCKRNVDRKMNEDSITYNISQICRFCLSDGGVMSTIFDEEKHGSTVPLAQIIMMCVSIQVNEGDGLPSLICHRCLYQMELCYEFKVLCKNSDTKLRQYLGGIKQEPIEIEEDVLVSQNFATDGMEQPSDIESMVVNVDPSELEIIENRTVVLTDIANSNQKPAVIKIKLPPSVDITPLDIKQETIVSEVPMNFQTIPEPVSEYLKEPFQHQPQQLPLRPFVCNLCGKGFGHRRELTRHHFVHSGEKPFACPVCGKKFARRDKVVSHLKIHGRRNTYNCLECPAMFICREELRRHEMEHTGKQPWACHTCKKTFCSKADLLKHRKTHRIGEDSVYKCHLCTATYHQQEKLEYHMKFHGEPTIFHNASNSTSDQTEFFSQLNSSYNSNSKSDSCDSLKIGEHFLDIRSNDESGRFISRLGQNPEILLLPVSQ